MSTKSNTSSVSISSAHVESDCENAHITDNIHSWQANKKRKTFYEQKYKIIPQLTWRNKFLPSINEPINETRNVYGDAENKPKPPL